MCSHTQRVPSSSFRYLVAVVSPLIGAGCGESRGDSARCRGSVTRQLHPARRRQLNSGRFGLFWRGSWAMRKSTTHAIHSRNTDPEAMLSIQPVRVGLVSPSRLGQLPFRTCGSSPGRRWGYGKACREAFCENARSRPVATRLSTHRSYRSGFSIRTFA